MERGHTPVLLREVVEILRPAPHKRFLDMTVGAGGHAEELLRRSEPGGELLGLDRDDEALALAADRLARFGERCVLRRANFTEARAILGEMGWEGVHGIVLDLGLSSIQLGAPDRGFSFSSDGRLDMRMDRRQTIDAHRLVNTLSAGDLERVLRVYGEEPRARRIALAIERARRKKTVETARELAEIVALAVGWGGRRIHPATRTFQALRVAVNREQESLNAVLEDGYELLLPGGRMATVSFHSLEDRLVKNGFRRWSSACLCPPGALVCSCGWSPKARLLNRRPIVPSEVEVNKNPRARSAKLRAVERL